jgi:phosphatidate cytidylyltransferase
VLAFPILAITWIGGKIFILFSIVVAAFVFYEWNSFILPLESCLIRGCGWLCYGTFSVALFYKTSASILILIILLACCLIFLASYARNYWAVFGFIYSSLLAMTLSFLSAHAVFFLYAVVWGTDSGAYFCGRIFGGFKLAPVLSPGKTWSGALGGLIIGIVSGMCLAGIMMEMCLRKGCIVFSIACFISIASQMGDLGESWLKRRFSVKDSSNILPGHGGVMDRIDGLVVASVLLYIMTTAFNNPIFL